MSLKNVIELGVEAVQSCVQVDDTVPGIEEGLNAGMWTVGIAISGNEIGLTLADWRALPQRAGSASHPQARQRLLGGGAHYVIDTIADLPSCLDIIGALGARRTTVIRRISQPPAAGRKRDHHDVPANRVASTLPGREGRRLLDEDARYFLRQSVSTPCLAVIHRAEGCWIEDSAGRRYLDFHGNSVHHLGYGHPRLLAAIKAQLDELSFAPRRFTCEPAVDLARRLARSARRAWKSLFATGGSDAVEIALKIARAATGRFKTLSFGMPFMVPVSARPASAARRCSVPARSDRCWPGTEHLPPFACYRCPYGHPCDEQGQPDLERCRLSCAELVRYVLEREGDVAAVIAEPAAPCPPFRLPVSGRSCARLATLAALC